MFSSILKQETAFFDKTRTGELINRLSSDTALLGRSLTENLSDGLRAGAQASVGVGMMVWQSVSCLLLPVASYFFHFRECSSDRKVCVLLDSSVFYWLLTAAESFMLWLQIDDVSVDT